MVDAVLAGVQRMMGGGSPMKQALKASGFEVEEEAMARLSCVAGS